MKRLTFFLAAIISLSAFTQDSVKRKPNADFKRVLIGVNFSPDVCYRALKNNDDSWSSDMVIGVRNDEEIPKLGFTTGLNVCFNITPLIGIETGIQYSEKGFQTKMKNFIFGWPNPTLPTKGKFIDHFHYVEVPVKINFTVGRKKVRFFTSVGLTVNILVKATGTFVQKYSNGTTERDTNPQNYDFKRVNLSPAVSAGIDYKINSRMNLRVEPIFRFGILKIIDTPVTGYLYSGGINIGYYFGL